MDRLVQKHPFPAIINTKSELLILGSTPSIKSVEQGFFYMHPQNRFWKVLSSIYHEDFFNVDINTKIDLLNKYHIALYDVIDSCTIYGSSDNKISRPTPINLAKILANTNIKKIYLNGKKAYDLFIHFFPTYKNMAIYLPSTSPANATYSLEKLIACWQQIRV